MALLELVIGKISISTEKETGGIIIPIGMTEIKSYRVSLINFCLKKKMYQPTEILADLEICMVDGLDTEWKPVDRKTLEKLFKHKKVSLYELEHDKNHGQNVERKVIDVIGEDYYVHEVLPCYKPDSMVVKLKIYSLDKLLTVSRYCSTWTAKKLSEHILASELPNYKVPYDTGKHLEWDSSQMKHLLKNHQEHIFPYLVQYNESFYDMLIRTCNRWGEYVYWEDGKLRIGYNGDEGKAKQIKDFYSISYHDYAAVHPVSADGTYAAEAPYDNNVLNSNVAKNGFAKVFGTIKNMADLEDGADYYWLGKVGQVLTNNKSIMNFLFDSAVNDLLAWAQQDALVSQYNDDHNADYFKKKKKYISMLDEQYDNGKKTLNQFSEFEPIVDAKHYAKVLAGEMLAEQNTIDIDYDTTWPGLKLGNIIDVNDDKYIVTEISAEKRESSLVFRVIATAKDDDDALFYPTMIPSGHIRTSGPQVGIVVDVQDPTRKNRVRLKYPWQFKTTLEKITASDLKGHDVSDATPWLLYASSSGPAGAGVHGRHYLAEKVLVNFANNNVERPFVVGAVSTATPGSLKTGSAVLQAPNGEYVKVHEGSGKGATAFMANFTPGLSLVNGFIDFPDFFGDNEMSKAFEGGVDIGDRYGIWKISGSTDKRAINISSPWGTVSVNAFTGISINAPNGNVSIKGKNVSIEAGNNLTLTSGTNIRNKFISSYGDGGFNITTFMYDVAEMAAKKLASMVESIIDLSLIRSLIEVYWRPQEGALSIQSNRYLKLSAGGAKAGYPDAAYLDPKKKAKEAIEQSGVLKMGPTMDELLSKVPLIVEKMMTKYNENYKACVTKKSEFVKTINLLRDVSNNWGSDICLEYKDLKGIFWDPKTEKITDADLGFTDNCKSDSIDDVNLAEVSDARDIPINCSKDDLDKERAEILEQRKKRKADVVKMANALLKCIAKLRTEPQKLGDLTAYGIGRHIRKAPTGYMDAFKKAVSAEMCKNTTFYKLVSEEGVIKDARANLTMNALNGFDFHKKALIRQIAMNLIDGWGMKSGKAMPASDTELENDDKWNDYVSGLEFTKPLTQSGNFLDAVVAAFDPSSLNLATPIKEYYSWGNAKAGQILFGTGSTLCMNSNGNITQLDASDNQGKLSKALLNEKEQGEYDSLNSQVQKSLRKLGGNAGNNNDIVQEYDPDSDNQDEDNNNIIDNNIII